MIIKRKLFTNAEGPKTKEVRKKTDKRDIAIAGLYGAGTGAYIGSLMAMNPALLGTVTGAATAGTAALTAAARRRNNKKGKNPHKPDELFYYNPEDYDSKRSKIGRGLSIGGATVVGGYYGSGLNKYTETRYRHAAKLANKILDEKGKIARAHPEDAEKFRNWVGGMHLVHGDKANGKILKSIVDSEAGKKIIDRKMIRNGAIGAAGLGGYVALAELHKKNKKKALYDAWQEDKKNSKKDGDKKKED